MNRPTDDDLSVVGLYLEPLPIRITYPSLAKTTTQTCNEKETDAEHEGHIEQDNTQSTVQDGSTTSYLETVRQSSQMALAHAVPWHQLLELIGSDTAYPSHPLFDIMVSFHETSQTEKIGQVVPGVKPCFAWSEGSKFKLMVEFSAFGEEVLMMRLEHDTKVFAAEEIYRLERMIPMALEILTDDEKDMKVDSITRELRGVEGVHKSATVLDAEEVFGKAIAEL